MRYKRKPKRFVALQFVEIQRDTGFNVQWEPARYIGACDEMRGWHRVAFAPGAPPRFIDRTTGYETTADNPQARPSDTMLVPTRRIREQRNAK